MGKRCSQLSHWSIAESYGYVWIAEGNFYASSFRILDTQARRGMSIRWFQSFCDQDLCDPFSNVELELHRIVSGVTQNTILQERLLLRLQLIVTGWTVKDEINPPMVSQLGNTETPHTTHSACRLAMQKEKRKTRKKKTTFAKTPTFESQKSRGGKVEARRKPSSADLPSGGDNKKKIRNKTRDSVCGARKTASHDVPKGCPRTRSRGDRILFKGNRDPVRFDAKLLSSRLARPFR